MNEHWIGCLDRSLPKAPIALGRRLP